MGMISKEDLEAHPEWNAEQNGKRQVNKGFLCWGNPEVAVAVAKTIVERLDKQYVPSVSLSPNDGMGFCQCEKYCKPLDAGDMDPSMGIVSITDRYIHFCNRIAEIVCKKHPNVKFGFLAYVHYTRPPVREKMHPNLIPQIAPITYCRAHAMTSENCESRNMMKPIVEGWTKVAKRVSYYNYMFHLAEVAVPYPMANFESVAPGMWLTIRMAWDSSLKPAEVMDEFYRGFYGVAGDQMRKYWEIIDNAWMDNPEHAGCAWGYTKRFTPEVMKAARAAMDEAMRVCATRTEYRRVEIFNESLMEFERFMALRWDLAEGRLTNIDRAGMVWLGTHVGLSEKYAENYTFARAGFARYGTIGASYFNAFFKKTYDDAGRIAARGSGFHFLTPAPGPLRKWQYSFIERKDDPSESTDTTRTITEGESKGYQKADFDSSKWPTTDVAVDTWAAMGMMNSYGTMWYRADVKLPKLTDGKKVYLWISATDGSAKVYVNGKHVKYKTEKGEEKDVADGYTEPFSFDVTEAVKSGESNQITIAGTRLFINELGCGGLLSPVYFYVEE